MHVGVQSESFPFLVCSGGRSPSSGDLMHATGIWLKMFPTFHVPHRQVRDPKK